MRGGLRPPYHFLPRSLTMKIDDYLDSPDSKANYRKAPYAQHRWQHEAVVYAEKLGFTPNKAWFKFFKQNFEKHEPKFRSILEKAVNPNITNKDKYFYWMYHNENRPRTPNKS